MHQENKIGLVLLLMLFGGISYTQTISSLIKVNQVGYLINADKVAYVSSENTLSLNGWEIKSSSANEIVLQGNAFGAVIDDASSDEFVYAIDFSSFNQKGNFYINIPGIGRSYDFVVSTDTYNEVFKTIMKGFYYQRSGVELKAAHAGKWAKPAEYKNDAFIYTGFDGTNIQHGAKVDAAGGWRDAGDPNKKVVPASIAVHQLMMLYEYFPDRISTSSYNIPSDAQFPNLPDFLTEVKVELDWLLTMQRTDGAVYHAVGQKDFFLTGLGHLDNNPRYLLPVSTTATGDFAAAMAQAYRVFLPFNSSYANQCLQAAEQAWTALNTTSIWNTPNIIGHQGTLQYPESKGYSQDPPGINNTAVYTDTEDKDERYFAAAELYISTKKESYHTYFKSNLESGIWYPSLWPAVANYANFSYVMAFKNENNPTVNQLRNSISAYADVYTDRIKNTGFGICLAPADYYWGSNNLAGQFAYNFLLAYEILGKESHKKAALALLNYILGTNSLNQTFVSGVGAKTVENIFHLPSLYDGIEEVVPGLIPGGPNQFPTTDVVHADFIAAQSPPPAKCYIDSEYSFASNEAVILESAVWAFVTGYLYDDAPDADNDGYTTQTDCNDNDPLVNLDQTEIIYNGKDDDCNPLTLDDDLDEDGVPKATDCDDNNAQINPNQTEVPYNGIDDDCNPNTLDDDLDEDGVPNATDCDDNNAQINPNQTEVPYNGIDDDCNPNTLDDDLDEDGFPKATDCDDTNKNINPDAEEIINNGVDENCDGEDLVSSLEETNPLGLSLFPNPATNWLSLDGNINGVVVTIYTIDGREVTDIEINKLQINISALRNGVYILLASSDEKISRFKFVKVD